MKKIILVLLILAVVGGAAFAFDPLSYPPPLYGGGSIMVDAGAGYWYSSFLDFGGFGVPPLFVDVEYALPVGVPISFGAGVSFFQWKFSDTNTQTWITPHVRTNWHFGFDVSWLDLYLGFSFGGNIISKENYHGSTGASSGPYGGAHVGAHLYFSHNVGAVIEAGYPFVFKAGLALKFGGGVARTTATVTTDVNLRTGPSTDYPVIVALPQGTVVTLTGQIISGWTEVTYNDQTGWISSPYLTTRR